MARDYAVAKRIMEFKDMDLSKFEINSLDESLTTKDKKNMIELKKLTNDLSIILTYGFGTYLSDSTDFQDLRKIYHQHLKNRKKYKKNYDRKIIHENFFRLGFVSQQIYPTEDFKRLKHLQKRIQYFFENKLQPILEWVNAPYNTIPYSLSSFTKKEIDLKGSTNIGIYSDKHYGLDLNSKWNEAKYKSKFYVITETEPYSKLENLLEFIFINSLHGMPYNKFKKCDCGNWFIRERKENECSKRCYMRIFSRKNRARIKKQNPKKYQEELTAGNKRAKRSYRKKF